MGPICTQINLSPRICRAALNINFEGGRSARLVLEYSDQEDKH